MSLLEDWLNMFGGDSNLKPNTPSSTQAEAWRTNARNVPSTRPVIPASTTAVPAQTTVPKPQARTVHTPTNAAGVVDKMGDNKVNWRFAAPDQSIPRGSQVVPIAETTGRSVTRVVPPEPTPPKFKLPWQAPKIRYGSVLGAPAAGAEALLHSESLNTDEFGGEDGQKWLDENRPKGWTPSTMAVEETIGSAESISSKGKREAISLAESKLKLMTESGASQTLIDGAAAELKEANGIANPNHLAEFEANTKSDLSSVQERIDAILQETGSNPELANLRVANEGLFAQRDDLNAKLSDAGKIRAQRIAATPVVKALVTAAADIDPKVVEGLTPEAQALVDAKAAAAAKLLEENKDADPKTVMQMAGKALGSLFDDPAIKQALIYYTGARLMGYSGSGSGMAAGQVLLQGWANQDKQDLLTQTATSKANAKKAENDALDMSKTVSMWNPRTRQQEIGYMSKSGNFQRSSGGEIYNAREQGLQTYDKSNPMHRTGEELDSSNVENMDKAVKDVLANISGNKDIYTDEQRQTAQALFADGADLNAAYAIATRSARVAGADTGSTAYQNAVTGSIRKYMMRTIKNPTDAFSGNNVAGMVDAIRSDQLKAELTVEGSIPEFVFGKGTWTANGVSQMEEDYQLPYEAVATLNKRVDSINANLVANALENKHSPVKIKSLITPTKTLQRLAGIFKETVMKDPDALKHWSKVAAGSNTNAMGAWLASNKSTADHKYLGINNPDIAAKFQLLVDKQLEKK